MEEYIEMVDHTEDEQQVNSNIESTMHMNDLVVVEENSSKKKPMTLKEKQALLKLKKDEEVTLELDLYDKLTFLANQVKIKKKIEDEIEFMISLLVWSHR